MWNFKTFYPYGKLNTFSISGRAQDIFDYVNVHPHRNNYSRHKGFGNPGAPTENSYQDRAINDGMALRTLPLACNYSSPYIEVVWNVPGAAPGASRMIYNKDNWNEIYFTDDHYSIYWKVEAGESKHIIF